MRVAPPSFRPARCVEMVRCRAPSFGPGVRPSRRKGARRRGQLYEQRCHVALQELYGEDYIPSPWFQFRETGGSRLRYCQPDALLLLPALRRLIVLEMKLQHTADAWWQIEHLYRPVLEWMFLPDVWEICAVEVVRWFDPATVFPERPAMLPDILAVEPGRFGVHIFDPHRR